MLRPLPNTMAPRVETSPRAAEQDMRRLSGRPCACAASLVKDMAATRAGTSAGILSILETPVLVPKQRAGGPMDPAARLVDVSPSSTLLGKYFEIHLCQQTDGRGLHVMSETSL